MQRLDSTELAAAV